jgi:plasmid stabilization system protein ParE
MRRVELAPAAQDEIEDIVEFIAVDSPTAANRVRVAIGEAIVRIGEWPSIGHTREDLTTRPVRFWNVMGRYTLVYESDDTSVRVLRVFGPGQDIARRL